MLRLIISYVLHAVVLHVCPVHAFGEPIGCWLSVSATCSLRHLGASCRYLTPCLYRDVPSRGRCH